MPFGELWLLAYCLSACLHLLLECAPPRRDPMILFLFCVRWRNSASRQSKTIPSSKKDSRRGSTQRLLEDTRRGSALERSFQHRMSLCTSCSFLSKVQPITIKRTLLDCHFNGLFLLVIGPMPYILHNSVQPLIIRFLPTFLPTPLQTPA